MLDSKPLEPVNQLGAYTLKRIYKKVLKDYNKMKITVKLTVGATAAQLQPYRSVSY